MPTPEITQILKDNLADIKSAVETAIYPVGATSWTVTGDSAANTALTTTKAAVAGKSHYITAIEVVISAANAGADIKVLLREDNAGGGAATLWKEIIGNGAGRGTRCGIVFNTPIKLTAAKTADLVVDAGGAAVVTSCNMAGYTL